MLRKRWTFGLGGAAVILTLVIHFTVHPEELLKLSVYYCAPSLLNAAGPLDNSVYLSPWRKTDPESTPLVRALSSGCFDLADKMISDGMRLDESFSSERVRSPLHWSIHARDDLALEWLIKHISELDRVDYNGDTPLYESVIFGNRPAFTRLLSAGAKLRPPDIVFEKSPMLQVLVHPDGSWLQSALARVEAGSLEFNSWCPLVYWLSGDVERSLDSVETLLARGAQPVCRNTDGILTLEAAAEAQNLRVIHRLLKTHPPLAEVDRTRIDRVLRERNEEVIINLFRGWQAAL